MRVAPVLDRIGRLSDLVEGETDRTAFTALRAAESTGRALGSNDFVAALERITGRRLQLQKPGRKPVKQTDQLQLRLPGTDKARAMGKASP